VIASKRRLPVSIDTGRQHRVGTGVVDDWKILPRPTDNGVGRNRGVEADKDSGNLAEDRNDVEYPATIPPSNATKSIVPQATA